MEMFLGNVTWEGTDDEYRHLYVPSTSALGLHNSKQLLCVWRLCGHMNMHAWTVL